MHAHGRGITQVLLSGRDRAGERILTCQCPRTRTPGCRHRQPPPCSAHAGQTCAPRTQSYAQTQPLQHPAGIHGPRREVSTSSPKPRTAAHAHITDRVADVRRGLVNEEEGFIKGVKQAVVGLQCAAHRLLLGVGLKGAGLEHLPARDQLEQRRHLRSPPRAIHIREQDTTKVGKKDHGELQRAGQVDKGKGPRTSCGSGPVYESCRPGNISSRSFCDKDT